jgi:protein-L-isoaspartate(D-aspartate) O-methyltransferase
MDFSRAINRMVDEQIVARGIKDGRVIDAMRRISRHLFVEEALQSQAYNDYPLPIGYGQTISQPYMVALMTDALELKGHEQILEIGTGSGYQTALLAILAEKVYSIERISELAARARKTLDELDCYNVEIKIFDGTYGWKEKAPFDAIMVTAGAPDVPQPLLDQLAIGGRIVIPVGEAGLQDLFTVTRTEREFVKKNLGGCRFVKLIGRHGWDEGQ